MISPAERLWLNIKCRAALMGAFVFGLGIFLSFGVIVFELIANAMEWLKTGVWGETRKIDQVFTGLSASVERMEWVGAQRIARWLIDQSMLWVYAGIGVICYILMETLTAMSEHFEFELERSDEENKHDLAG